MNIRELEPERDAPAVVELLREVSPTAVISVASWLHRLRSAPPRTRAGAWAAEVDGQFAGRAEAFLNPFNDGSENAVVLVAVHGRFRRQGIGSALFERGLEHARAVGARMLLTSFSESTEGLRFAEARGFSFERAEQLSVLDPRAVHDTPPAGVDLRPVRAIDPRDLHLVDETTTRDIPATEPIEGIAYDEWEQHVLAHPLFTLDGSFVAYVDGEPAACSMLTVDPESGRAENWMTGTMPQFRGRGLAHAVKLASIRWAAEQGVTSMVTTNDETNAPMLAINRRLGYRPAGRRVEFSRSAD